MMRRRVLVVVLAVLGAAGVPASASAETTTIRMPGKFFDPARSSSTS